MFSASKSGKYTAPVLVDPQFNYVTALLHGDGTNGAQNNTFVDSSTNNATITRTGTPTQGSFSPYGSLWSNYFGGSTDYLSTPSSATFSGNFTFEQWMNIPSNTSTYIRIMGIGDCTTTSGFQMLINPSNGFFYINYNSSFAISGSTIVNINTWNHFALVRSGSTWTAYLNGISQGTYTSSATLTGTMYINAINSAGTVYATSIPTYCSNSRITNTAVYTSNFTPSTTPLTAVTGTQVLTCQTNRFQDVSGTYTLTVNGTPSVQRFNPFLPTSSQAYSTSVYGGSGNFNGTTDYLTGTLSTAIGSGNFTIECWVYLRALVDYEDFFSITRGAFGFNIGTDSTGVLTIYNNVGGRLLTSSTGALKVNQWTHVAYVRSGTTLTGFINGVSFGTVTNATVFSATAFAIGDLDSSNSEYLNGYLTDTRLTNTVVYSGNFTPSTAPLSAVSGTLLLVNYQNGAIYDNAMMNDWITVGGVQINTSVKKYGTGSVSFDGTTGYLLPNPPTTNLYAFGSGNFTIEMWIYPTTSSGGTRQIFYDSKPSGGSGFYVTISLYTGTNISFYTNGNDQITGGAVTFNVWSHVALVKNGSTTTLYLNGVSQGTYADSNTYLNPTQRPVIGTNGGALPSAGFYGYVDDLRVTKGYARYTSNFTPPTAALPNYGS